MLRKIYLHGAAAELAPSIELDADTPAMLFAGLNSAFKGFRAAMNACDEFSLVVARGNGVYEGIKEDELGLPFGDADEIHLVAKAKGEIAEAAFAYFVGLGMGTALAYVATAVVMIAMSFAMSAIVGALAPSPATDKGGSEAADNQPSFMFNGSVNVVEEGYAVPIVYGRVLTGSVVISVGTEVENITL